MKLTQKYAAKFYIKVIQISVQGDHVHALISTTRRSQLHHFFRVVAGQIAQRFEKEGLLQNPRSAATDTPNSASLWKYRPFTRVIRGYKAYKTVKNYILLNELEITGRIPYRKNRLKGLSLAEWEILWS